MLKRLLVPLDGSPMSEAVLPAVAGLARWAGAAVTLLHVLEHRPPLEVHGQRHLTGADEAEEYLSRLAGTSFPPGLEVRWHVHREPIRRVGASLALHAEEFKPDLLVMCSHGGRRLRDRLWGNIAQQVIARRVCPVLLLGDGKEAFPFRRLLAPLDGQAEHEQALPPAAEIAAICRCPITLLTVVPTVGSLSGHQAVTGSMLPGATREALDMSEASAVEYLRRHVDSLLASGLDAAGSVARGDPAREIIAIGGKVGANLIVLATHGKAGSEAFWEGSVASKVVRQAVASFLLVPALAKGSS